MDDGQGLLTQATYRCGAILIDAGLRQVLVDGEPAKLGARAFDVLLTLVERRHRIVSKRELLTLAWHGLVFEENNLQVQVVALRKLFGPQAIATVPGRGYRFTLAVAGGPAGAPPDSGGARPRTEAAPRTLSRDVVPLFGRDRDIAALSARIADGRVVTIVGAGGIGKTRVAQALVAQQAERWRDGAWFVELAPVSDPALVASTIAATLGLDLGEGRSATDLAARMAPLEALLVIDNCEHLVEAVSEVVERIVAGAPQVRVLATSQELLKVAGEHVFRLETLSVPEAETAHDIASYGAVQLFLERVRALVPNFTVQASNRQAIVEICRRLDGLPLAIELAAARVPVLGVDGLRDHLGERFRVLTGGARMALRKHQTLRAALDWSHELLSPAERVVFRRLGVFAGGFTLELGQLVAADERIDGWAVLEQLAHLVEKSLVNAEGGEDGGVPRYGLLETARAFALEQLAAAGEAEAWMRRHAEVMRDYVDTIHRQRWTLSMAAGVVATRELDNLRAALDWALAERGDRLLAIDLLARSTVMWNRARLTKEAYARIQAMLPLPSGLGARREADFCRAQATLGSEHANREADWQAARRAESLYRQLGDDEGLAAVLLPLAVIAAKRGDGQAAEQALSEADTLIGTDGPLLKRVSAAVCRTMCCIWRGDYEGAIAASRRQVALYRDAGHRIGESIALGNHGWPLIGAGRYDEAAEVLDQAIARLREDRLDMYLAVPLSERAKVEALRGGPADALAMAREAHRHASRHGFPLAALFAAARHFANAGDLARAAVIEGHRRSQWMAVGIAPHPAAVALDRNLMDELSAGLPAHRLGALLALGERLTAAEAAAYAFEDRAIPQVGE